MEESILKLNRYLPENLRTNDISKLINILDVILSVRLVISSLDILTLDNIELSNGDNSYTLPNEINSIILEQLHPYYIQEYCNSSKSFDNTCKSNIYPLLRKWCYPNLSISQIEEILPNATFSQLIELATVYTPIPESIYNWDRVTLFYHACRLNYANPETYIDIFTQDMSKFYLNIQPFYTVTFICYKFERTDIIDKMIELSRKQGNYDISSAYLLGINMVIAVKQGKYNPDNFKGYDHIFEVVSGIIIQSFANIMNTTFTYAEIVEFVIFGQKYYPTNESTRLSYTDLINGPEDNNVFDATYILMHCAMKITKQGVQNLLNKYQMRDVIKVDYSKYELKDSNNRRLHRQYLRETHYIPDDGDISKCIYGLTSGDFALYINYKLVLNTFDVRRFLIYHGINDFGQKSFNNRFMFNFKLRLDYLQPAINISEAYMEYVLIYLL